MGSSRTRVRTCVPCIGREILNHCATREAPIYILKCNLLCLLPSPKAPVNHITSFPLHFRKAAALTSQRKQRPLSLLSLLQATLPENSASAPRLTSRRGVIYPFIVGSCNSFIFTCVVFNFVNYHVVLGKLVTSCKRMKLDTYAIHKN